MGKQAIQNRRLEFPVRRPLPSWTQSLDLCAGFDRFTDVSSPNRGLALERGGDAARQEMFLSSSFLG
jgi:hypothetical protein